MNTQRKRSFQSAIALGTVCFILFTPSISQGWGAGGHMIGASIAYERLNPRAKAKVNDLLAIPINPANVSRESKDFVNASHWADNLRPFKEFESFTELHFIDKPFSLDGTPLPPVPSPNIVTALHEQVQILRASTDRQAQAQALRFIIHFVGDIHQPLHCVTRVDRTHPEGDRGGNLVSVSLPMRFEKHHGLGIVSVSLHSYWDGGAGSFPKSESSFIPPSLSSIRSAAAKAKIGNSALDPKLKLKDPMNFELWADESFVVARDVAYKGITNDRRLTNAYQTNSAKVARKRVAWAGYRLAALLNSIWP